MIHHLHPLPTELYSLICTVLWKADPYLGLHLVAPFSVFSWVWPVTGISKGLRGGSRRGWDISPQLPPWFCASVCQWLASLTLQLLPAASLHCSTTDWAPALPGPPLVPLGLRVVIIPAAVGIWVLQHPLALPHPYKLSFHHILLGMPAESAFFFVLQLVLPRTW